MVYVYTFFSLKTRRIQEYSIGHKCSHHTYEYQEIVGSVFSFMVQIQPVRLRSIDIPIFKSTPSSRSICRCFGPVNFVTLVFVSCLCLIGGVEWYGTVLPSCSLCFPLLSSRFPPFLFREQHVKMWLFLRPSALDLAPHARRCFFRFLPRVKETQGVFLFYY